MQRYDIFEDFGCRIPLLNTSLGIVLIPAWKLVISLISGVYGCKTNSLLFLLAYLIHICSVINLYHMWIKRQTIRALLGSSTGGLNFSRYTRLLLLSGIDLLITIPFNIWVFTAWFPVFPWQSWTETHADFSRVDTFPLAIWRGIPVTHVSKSGSFRVI